MSWLSKFLHPEKGYDKAQEQLDKYYGQSQGYLQPYNQYGQSAYGDINTAMKNLLDPTELNKKWIESYSESPQAKQAEALAQEHGLNAASGLGLMGSNTALDAIQSGTTQIGLNDRQNYLDDLMKKYMSGVGIGQDIFGKGAAAAGQQGQNAMNMGSNSAQMAYGKENAQGDLFSKLLGGGLGLVGSALGGPVGGALGAGLSQKMGWSPTGSYNPGGR
jgi:hypothetical protein